ncbi:MAG: TetR family transcriptional regulator [Actinobacteria bacterium]|nr:TetR family transcriptional regulator [Actinomycetota bacterium]
MPGRGGRGGSSPRASTAESPARPGLRERKKARTRAAIRQQALRLIREQGYDGTTVEQIAEAAEVSPSTFFRYFPTKEDVVLQDDMEFRWADALRAQPPDLGPIAAIRASLLTAMGTLSEDDLRLLQESAQLSTTVPAIRARMLDDFGRTMQIMSEMLAERTGRSAEDLAVRSMAGAVLGIAMTAWFASPGDLMKFGEEFERGLALLEAGLPL